MSAAPAERLRTDAPARARVAVVGISIAEACGVRDHATLLADALADEGVACSMHWLQRRPGPVRESRAQVLEFARRLREELAADPPDAVLVHYSVFAYSHKGVPLFVRPVFAALAGLPSGVVVFMHEFVYPWRYGGWRGAVWAVSQRAVLGGVVRRANALVVTAEARARWLSTRSWLPRRPVALAPVFSNLPPPREKAVAPGRIGVFGYSYDGVAATLVLDALARMRREGTDVTLRLLGAPGADSDSGARWRAFAVEHGVAEALSFTGRIPGAELSDELAACELLLFVDTAGPTSRKGTLAGSLASGRPVLALDGPARWPALIEAGAVAVVRPDPAVLAREAAALLADGGALAELGARGRAFYEREMTLERTTEVLAGVLLAPRHAESAAS